MENQLSNEQAQLQKELIQLRRELLQLHRELHGTRIFSAVSSILIIALLVGGGFVFGYVKEYSELVLPIVENLAAVDFENLNETLYTLNNSLNSVDWAEMSGQLEELDVEAINEAVAGLDTQELSKSLENLNTAVETLQRLGESLKSFMGKFGF